MTRIQWNDRRNEIRDIDSDLTIQEMNHYHSSIVSFMGGYSSTDSLNHSLGGRGPLFSEDGYFGVQKFSNNIDTFDREMGQSVNLFGGIQPTLSLSRSSDSAAENSSFSFSLTSDNFPASYGEIFYDITGVNSNQVDQPLSGSFTDLNTTQSLSFVVNNIDIDTTITLSIDEGITESIGSGPVSSSILVRDITEVTRITNGFTIGQAAIFNNWDRFSHSGNAYPANPGEMTTWAYDPNTGSIFSTINSGTYIGFVSNDPYSNYTIQSKITSTNGDNDRLGVVIAYLEDVAGDYGTPGRQYTLSAIRNQDAYVDHQTDSWYIVYNYLQNDGQLIVNGSSFIPYVGTTGWNAFPDGTTIRVERVGNVVTCYSTDPGSTTLKGGISVDLSTSNFGGILNKFMGSSQIGFSCFSQADAAFSNLNISLTGGSDLGFFNEGETIVIDVETRNNENTSLDFEVRHNGAIATDISPATGSFNITGNFFLKTGSFNFAPTLDLTADGAKDYVVNILKNGIVKTSSTFSVSDTSN